MLQLRTNRLPRRVLLARDAKGLPNEVIHCSGSLLHETGPVTAADLEPKEKGTRERPGK